MDFDAGLVEGVGGVGGIADADDVAHVLRPHLLSHERGMERSQSRDEVIRWS